MNKMQNSTEYSYWKTIWNQFRRHHIGFGALIVVMLFCIVGLYAPFFASSKPFILKYDGRWYFPLFRYLFYTGFFTKPIDIYYNILMFVLPLTILAAFFFKTHIKTVLLISLIVQIGAFLFLISAQPSDPASNPQLEQERQEALRERRVYEGDAMLAPFTTSPGWDFDLKYMNDYAKINLLLREKLSMEQHQKLNRSLSHNNQEEKKQFTLDNFPSMWAIRQKQENGQRLRWEGILSQKKTAYLDALNQLPQLINAYLAGSGQSEQLRQNILQKRAAVQDYREAEARLNYLNERRAWIQKNIPDLSFAIMPLVRPFHWEDDAGGAQDLNQEVNWWNLTRINRKDLMAALIFGVRVSLVVGITAVVFALAIGIPMGSIAGYFGGRSDLLISRLMEIWEAMPTFFMLLLVVAISQSKSIFLVIAVLGIFGWISIARFIRGEVLKQRNLTYVEACHSMGYKNHMIIFSHILPNAIPPVLTLLPFAVMGAIISEAGLSFLGLGEEGSSSWGVLMDEGRTVFPAESYLLWPPALLLTALLVAIALVGDALRDAIDPKMR